MGVVLNFNVCQSSDCSYLTFTELTGTYSTTNLTGWGSPNNTTAQADTATLAITRPDGIVITINLFTASFPTTNSLQPYIITSAVLGYPTGAKLPDGIYSFLYTVSSVASSFSFTQTKQYLYSCLIKCCVSNMFANFTGGCDCADDVQDQALKAWTFYQGLLDAAECGQINNFNNIMGILTRMCNNTSCNDCK